MQAGEWCVHTRTSKELEFTRTSKELEYTRARTHTHTHTPAHARTPTHTPTHTRTQEEIGLLLRAAVSQLLDGVPPAMQEPTVVAAPGAAAADGQAARAERVLAGLSGREGGRAWRQAYSIYI